jgi:hypothetical protein
LIWDRLEEWNITNSIDKKSFIIYSQKLAGYLMQKGFVLIDMQPDMKKTGKNVFFFNDTPQLKSAMDEYMSR